MAISHREPKLWIAKRMGMRGWLAHAPYGRLEDIVLDKVVWLGSVRSIAETLFVFFTSLLFTS